MDQPSAGIRNRISNKIQVIDKNEYGTTLSPFRSIQQEYEQSGSYTEDINSLEVGFSFQNEINDDIIATFGHGVVSDAIADPRFTSESSDRYPELTRIAEDYFKKYQGFTINSPSYSSSHSPSQVEREYDYKRLIKFYETSLFRAIKNYIPARTSLSTGIIVKQHLLERNRAISMLGITTETPIAKTPETGSNSSGYTTQTGFNSGISNKNLEITSSIGTYSLTGSAGGSVNKYNVITNEGRYFEFDNSNITLPILTNVNLFPTDATTPPAPITQSGIFLGTDFNGENYLESEVAFRSQIRFNCYLAVASAAPGVNFTIEMTSSVREGIYTNTFPTQTAQDPPSLVSENYVDIYPGERIYVYINVDNVDSLLNPIVLDGYDFEIGESTAFSKPEPKASQQVNWYIDNFTGEYKVDDHQTEFYNGEFSGSEITTIPPQYNPYNKKNANHLNAQYFYPNDAFTILPTQSLLFQNSPYNPLINNVSGSRKNSFLFDQDFDPTPPGNYLREGIPNDYALTVSASQLGFGGANPTNVNLLEYSEIPDSNYTAKAIITPRYEGSKMISADYNFYTGVPSESKMPAGITGLANPPYLLTQNKIQYVNGETGSWTGDTSYGKTAVIDRNPINIAHFKQSYENLSVFNTSTFIIDQLIQIPFEEILSEQSPIITSSLINGSNENLIAVTSTFSPTRKAVVLYNNPTKTFIEFDNTILNYGQLGIGSNIIIAGATDWKTYWTNQLLPSIMTTTQSFNAPEYTRLNFSNTTQFQPNADDVLNQIGLNFWYPDDREPFLSTVDSPNLITGNISASWGMSLFSTGSSTYAENKGLGILNLRGLPFNIPIRPPNLVGGSAGALYGPSLQIMNSLNRCQIIYGDANPSTTTGIPNYPPGIQNLLKLVSDAGSTSYDTFWGSQAVVGNSMGMQSLGTSANSAQSNIIPILDPNNIANLYRTDFSGSGLNNYEQLSNSEINIEPGDEIRISYGYPTEQSTGASGQGVIQNIVQDFQVIEYELAPPVVVTDPFNFPAIGSGFVVFLSGLITSSNVEFKNNPFQIDEYKRRLDIGLTNNICMYFADTNNSTTDTIASGSFLSSVDYDTYVVNSEGENRPTKIRVGINRSAVRYPLNNIGNTGPTGGWQFGTNNYGIINKSLSEYGAGYALQGPYSTDGESFARNVNLDPGFLFDRLIVYPNPSTLAQPIPSGSILSATLRKRLENDSKVVINLNQPRGSQGIQTPSGDGYLIPDDLTNIQQRNVQKIINKLKSENVFQQDSPNSLGS
jgi:hypothetical protein